LVCKVNPSDNTKCVKRAVSELADEQKACNAGFASMASCSATAVKAGTGVNCIWGRDREWLRVCKRNKKCH
jgi:hypothetical protein